MTYASYLLLLLAGIATSHAGCDSAPGTVCACGSCRAAADGRQRAAHSVAEAAITAVACTAPASSLLGVHSTCGWPVTGAAGASSCHSRTGNLVLNVYIHSPDAPPLRAEGEHAEQDVGDAARRRRCSRLPS